MSQVQDYETEKKYAPEDAIAEVHAVDGNFETGQGGNARLKRGLKARHICSSPFYCLQPSSSRKLTRRY